MAMRQITFKKEEEPDFQVLREYVFETIQNQKEGKEKKPERKLDKALGIPKELAIAFIDNSALKAAFEKLTPEKRGHMSPIFSMQNRK